MRAFLAAVAALLLGAGLVLAVGRDGGGGRAPAATSPTSVLVPTTGPAAPPTSAAVGELDGPEAVASRLLLAETALRSATTPEQEVAAHGRAQQQAYRLLVANPEWLPGVLARLPEGLRGTAEANVAAGRELTLLTGPVPPDRPLPRWRIVPPAPAADLLRHYRDAERATGVPWAYLAAIHLVETRMGRIRGDSVAGAQGPMQFIPSTWRIYGRGDVHSDGDAIAAAARMLKAHGAPSEMDRALFAYNPSRRYVRAITAYAGQMAADERAYLGYHAWQVYYGARLLPEGTDLVTGSP